MYIGREPLSTPLGTALQGGAKDNGNSETPLTRAPRAATIAKEALTQNAEVSKMRRTFSWTLIALCGATLMILALTGPSRLWGQRAETLTEVAEDTTSFEFALELDGETVGFFDACTGLASASDVYEETALTTDGLQMTQRRPGSKLLWEDLTLTRSVGASDAVLWDWREQIESSNWDEGLKDGQIVLYGPGGETARWSFTNGWPVRLSVDEAVETVTIAHDGIQRASEGTARRR